MALPELNTRSVLDVVNENFEAAGVKSYICRIVYAGDHALDKAEMVNTFKASVRSVNSSYCDVPLTGLLLIYDAYYVHILEGSEDTICRQLRFLMSAADKYKAAPPAPPSGELEVILEPPAEPPVPPAQRAMFKRMKLLMVYHSIKEITVHGWGWIAATPPTLLSKLDPYGPAEYHMEQLQTCLDKVKRLCAMYIDEPQLSFEGVSAADKKMEVIPEFILLELILDSKYILDLKKYLSYHRRIGHHAFYFERTWPPPTHFTPRHLYKLKVDEEFVEPLPLQEWQLRAQEKEKEKEGDEEKMSEESSDD